MSDSDIHVNSDDICIIGMACRFPGAKNPDEFWCNLRDGIESVSLLSDQELKATGVSDDLIHHPQYVKAAVLLEDIDLFDANFFGYSPREAERIDPQQRFFLECAWEALEMAGYNPERYPGRIGVYAGAGTNAYILSSIAQNISAAASADLLEGRIGSDKDFLTTRVSFKLNLTGPSMTIQTACSTSLVAVHLASESLLTGECDIALAGGATIHIPQKIGYLYEENGILSPDGHCRAFDENAKGMIGGSGVGVIALKRLPDAIAEGDYIHAIIKGSSVNNDGSSKAGFTAPGIKMQTQVILDALNIAGVSPDTISYVEAHGTGTPLGDPIEMTALTHAFRSYTQRVGFCAVGSVKTNVGHLDTAAGVAGLIKTVLALKHRSIPPSLNFTRSNPNIDLATSPFYVNTSLNEWRRGDTPLRAGVTALGIGGTNAHVILEEGPTVPSSQERRPWHILLLSALTENALENATGRLAEHLKHNRDVPVSDVAFTLQIGRKPMKYRRALLADSIDDAIDTLTELPSTRSFTTLHDGNDRPVAFMFPGGGAQQVNMARDIYDTEPLFQEQVDHCVNYLREILEVDISETLYPKTYFGHDGGGTALENPAVGLPALFTVEYALAKLWMSWGLEPHGMIGHSLGEYVTACLAGVFSLEDALRLVALRGRLFEQLPEGAMLSVPLSEYQVRPLLGAEVSLAAVNSPSACVVSGPVHAIKNVQETLDQMNVETRRLPISVAAHSSMVASIAKTFRSAVSEIQLHVPQIPFVSNVTGNWITNQEATDPNYWAMHLCSTVRFSQGIRTILRDSDCAFLEVGPGQTLSSLVRQQLDASDARDVFSSLRHPRRQDHDLFLLPRTLAQLWLAGVAVDWEAFNANERRRRVPLPTYPFERQRYWLEASGNVNDGLTLGKTASKREDLSDWFYAPSWNRSIPPQPSKQEETLHVRSSCLVFSDGNSIASGVIDRLITRGDVVVVVRSGDEFKEVGQNRYTVALDCLDSYVSLFRELDSLGISPDRVVHMWGLTSRNGNETGIELFRDAQSIGLYSLIHIAKSIKEIDIKRNIAMTVITSNIHEITGDEHILRPEMATVLGACRVISQEFPNIACKSVDIASSGDGTINEESIAEQLVAELVSNSTDVIVAYRAAHRWVQTFVPARLEANTECHARLRHRGVYLITGGLGGVGLLLAQYLSRVANARLVLVDRSGLPPQDKWHTWLSYQQPEKDADLHLPQSDFAIAAGPEDSDPQSVQEQIRKVSELISLGAEVEVMNANVANVEQMKIVIDRAHERFGKIDGVIHAAAIAGGGMIELATSAAMEEEFAPKVAGVLTLERLLENEGLDFLVLCSSLSSFIGGIGQIAYCAANAFLDAFAHRVKSNLSNYTVSINWDQWLQVGLAIGVERRHQHLRGTIPIQGMTAEEGVETFHRIICGNSTAQIVVSTQEFQAFLEQESERSVSDATQSLQQSNRSAAMHQRPPLEGAYVESMNDIELKIAEIWREVLGIERVGTQDDFFVLGGDSLIALRITNRLRTTFSVNLSIRSMFDTPTVADLALLVSDLVGRDRADPSDSQIEPRESKTLHDLLEDIDEAN